MLNNLRQAIIDMADQFPAVEGRYVLGRHNVRDHDLIGIEISIPDAEIDNQMGGFEYFVEGDGLWVWKIHTFGEGKLADDQWNVMVRGKKARGIRYSLTPRRRDALQLMATVDLACLPIQDI